MKAQRFGAGEMMPVGVVSLLGASSRSLFPAPGLQVKILDRSFGLDGSGALRRHPLGVSSWSSGSILSWHVVIGGQAWIPARSSFASSGGVVSLHPIFYT